MNKTKIKFIVLSLMTTFGLTVSANVSYSIFTKKNTKTETSKTSTEIKDQSFKSSAPEARKSYAS